MSMSENVKCLSAHVIASKPKGKYRDSILRRKPMSGKKRYAIVGTGSRSQMYSFALLGDYAADCELVGLCDSNPTRMAWANTQFKVKFGAPAVPAFAPADFE